MTSTDIFGGHNQEVDPVKAASALGDILAFFHGEATGNPISQGIGAQEVATNTTTTSTPVGEGQATGDHASPVPEGTGISQGYGVNGHPGIDFAVPLDTQLLAAASGTVTHASNDDPGGYGEWIEITTPDGIAIRYGHLHGMSVKVGDAVRAGQIIGTSGGEQGGALSGNSEGPHLHFEVRANGHSIDPTPFLAGGYQIIGGTGTTTVSTPDPKSLAAVQLQNVVNVLGGKPAQSIDGATTTSTTTATTGTGTPVVAGDMDSYFSAVLTRLGLPVTDANLRFMRAWQKAEGGDGTNPFNTTQDAPGATNFNSVGVKRYPDAQTGVDATVKTLSNGLYTNILDALRNGNDPMAAATALANSPWGTGALVQKILGG